MPLYYAPGEAYQFDWSHEVILISGVTVTVKVAHVRLCHSRMMFVRAYMRESQEMVFDAFNIAPNLLDCDFAAAGPNQKWAGDISYIWTREGWLYLAVILDLQSRRVIGWAVSNRMKRDLAIRALKMAITLRSPPRGCIFHSDRGSQYCSQDYQKILREHGFKASMSGKGNCYDNAAVEPALFAERVS